MRTWMKYLIVGWSIVSVGIIIVSFQLMQSAFVQENYTIMAHLKTPEKETGSGLPEGWLVVAEDLFLRKEAKDPDYFDTFISKKEFVERIKRAKSVKIESDRTVKDGSIYLILPIYAFLVWGIPILVFSLLGIVFERVKKKGNADQ